MIYRVFRMKRSGDTPTITSVLEMRGVSETLIRPLINNGDRIASVAAFLTEEIWIQRIYDEGDPMIGTLLRYRMESARAILRYLDFSRAAIDDVLGETWMREHPEEIREVKTY